ncbi:MAG: ABC transporter permease [Termitinemataceae bacterium]|nr:MAG: ABC transporter permease [Termitinemataceae bacterium]
MQINLIFAAGSLMLASMGVLLTELSGCLCIAAEGFMVLGAFFCYVFTLWTGSAFAGVFFSAVLCALIGLALIVFIQKCKADPFVAALALNLGSLGITSTLSQTLFGTSGVLHEISFNSGQRFMFVIAAVFFLILTAIFLASPYGKRLKAVGRSVPAAIQIGIHTDRYIVASWVLCAFFAAVAGASVVFRAGVYAPLGIAGRGWLAIAAVYLGFKNIFGLCASTFFLALVEQIAYNAQKISSLNVTAILGLPSFLALVLYAISQRKKHKLS